MHSINATKINRKFGKPRDLRCALPPNNCLQLFQPLFTSPWKRHSPLCHPEEPTCLCQVKGAMTLQDHHGCKARRAGRQT
jgi:hypothetical protein